MDVDVHDLIEELKNDQESRDLKLKAIGDYISALQRENDAKTKVLEKIATRYIEVKGGVPFQLNMEETMIIFPKHIVDEIL